MTDPGEHPNSPTWREIFSGELPELKRGRKILRLISFSAHDRCRLCYAGFDGLAAPLMRSMGRGQWSRNPHFCEKCESVLASQPGGAEIEIAVLYADVRGSTQMAARLGPTVFAELMQRFYQAAIKAFTWSDAIVDKMVGDEVIGLYVPTLMGGAHRKHAVAAGMELLAATGHGSTGEPWVSIGIGVHSGTAFVGSIRAAHGNYQFSALGDVMNFGARLVANAEPGELLMSEPVWNNVKGERECRPRRLDLKGYGPTTVYSARLQP